MSSNSKKREGDVFESKQFRGKFESPKDLFDEYYAKKDTESKKQKTSQRDPTFYAAKMVLEAQNMGDEVATEDMIRPLDGIEGMDQTLSSERRFLNNRSSDYYQNKAPFNYSEFKRMGGPQLVDKYGIMYRLADKKDCENYGLEVGNKLLRENIEPVGKKIVEDFKLSNLYPSHQIFWFAVPMGKNFPLPPRKDKNQEDVVFLHVKTRVPLFKGRISSENVFKQPKSCVGYLYVANFNTLYDSS
jgi:hypothetical protein